MSTALRTDLTRYGVTDVTPTTGLPSLSQVPVAAEELARILTDTSGYGAKRLNDAGLTQVGDVHLTATYLIHDSFGGGAGRLPAPSGISI